MFMVWVFSRWRYGLPLIEVTLCAVVMYGVGLLKTNVRFTHDGGQLVWYGCVWCGSSQGEGTVYPWWRSACLMWMCMVWVFSRWSYTLPMMEVSLRCTLEWDLFVIYPWMRSVCAVHMDNVCGVPIEEVSLCSTYASLSVVYPWRASVCGVPMHEVCS